MTEDWPPTLPLTTRAHPRDIAGMRYVYPVVSRRAGGVSVGINLNPNSACNWRCVYCQVPGLVRGRGEHIELPLLETELTRMLDAIVNGDFLERAVPADARALKDVAFSGNGEPTTSPSFSDAVELVGRTLERFALLGSIDVVLITNGSQLHKPEVQAGVVALARLGGTVWFKFDRGTKEGFAQVNSVALDPGRHLERLRLCASLCPTFVQTCAFARHGRDPDEHEFDEYIRGLQSVQGAPGLRGVLLYNLARPSQQAEAETLEPASRPWLESLASRIRAAGLDVRVFE